jgi:hypothetical protein
MNINIYDNNNIMLSEKDIINNIDNNEINLLHNYSFVTDFKQLKYGNYIRFINQTNFEIHIGGNLIKIHKGCFVIVSEDFTCYYYLPDNFYIFHRQHDNNTNFNMLDTYKKQLNNYKPVRYKNELIIKDISVQSKSSKQRDVFEKLLQKLETK